MALNNLERVAASVDRSVLYATLRAHPGAVPLLAVLGGGSQFLADTLRRYPTVLPWLLEPDTMRARLRDELAAELAANLAPFSSLKARWNVLRRFKYRELLRIGCRDLLGDADLTVTTEELSRLADACLEAAWRMADAECRARYGAPLTVSGEEAGLAIIGMGKLGGEELNYSSDIDLVFVYSEDGEAERGFSNAEYFTRVARGVVVALESVTEEGYAFRVDVRLRPEGRMGPLVLSLDGYRTYFAERAEPWERQALIKARPAGGDRRVGERFLQLIRPFVYRPGVDPEIVSQVRAMKREIDRSLRAKGGERANVKLGVGGIREVEFLVQALQLLYGGDDPWLRERNTLRAIFRLTERGYLSPVLARRLSAAYTFLRTVEHRLQIVHEFQTHTLPSDPGELGRLARRTGIQLPPERAARTFRSRYRAVTHEVHRAFSAFFEAPPVAVKRPRIPSVAALRATGFVDPERARQNLRLILEGRPLIPYPEPAQKALLRIFSVLLDALWKSPDPDEALNQFERFVAAMGPRAAHLELLADSPDLLASLVTLCARGEPLAQLLTTQPDLLPRLADPTAFRSPRREGDFRRELALALEPGLSLAERKDRLRRAKQGEELGIIWRFLLGVTTVDGFSRELTGLADAAVAVAWAIAVAPLDDGREAPPGTLKPLGPAVIVGLGKFGGRELTTGSDLDLFVIYEGGDAAHAFYDRAVERFAGVLGDITAAGTVFPVDLRLRPGSKGSGFASSLAALEGYYREWADLWERQSLARARVVWGDARLARRVWRALREIVYRRSLSVAELKGIREIRQRMELELGKETPGRFHVKYGRGGLVDVEFVVQALQLAHGHRLPALRRANTLAALRALGRHGFLAERDAAALADHYRFLRRVSASLRLFGARPPDGLEVAGPMPARVARGLDFPDRSGFLAEYRRRTAEVRKIYDRVFAEESSPVSLAPRLDRAP
ncbi:MAG: bifunctional [glutamate--ammonia ligase]-adenylyl-L-tyrosine phosphorylase/[glutamate--ammonia-ligase] adenylyltransferase [Candidatus Rokubacteria bacterium]|nr:bifunctional [glutamate--ammonia ligase]-adenylyl-L-tyrosine phosphorylase/[glutamate--ammonia-ligase] adenylyltransferase [Candidatus Rokubacteria bacterium]